MGKNPSDTQHYSHVHLFSTNEINGAVDNIIYHMCVTTCTQCVSSTHKQEMTGYGTCLCLGCRQDEI